MCMIEFGLINLEHAWQLLRGGYLMAMSEQTPRRGGEEVSADRKFVFILFSFYSILSIAIATTNT